MTTIKTTPTIARPSTTPTTSTLNHAATTDAKAVQPAATATSTTPLDRLEQGKTSAATTSSTTTKPTLTTTISPLSLVTPAALDDVIDAAGALAGATDADVQKVFADAKDAAQNLKKATTVEMPLRLAVTTGKANPYAAGPRAGTPQEVPGIVKQQGGQAVFYPADENIKPFPISAEQADVLPKDTPLVARATKKKADFSLPDGSVETAKVYQLGKSGVAEPRPHFIGVVDLVGGEPFVRDLMPPPRLVALPTTSPSGAPWKDGAIIEVRTDDKGAVSVEKTVAAAGSPKARTWMIAADSRLDAIFPEKAIDEAKAIEASAAEKLADKGLVDRRKEPFFAIDNPGSTDIDQCMRLQKRDDGGYVISYALADPAAYVKPGMALFNEAMQRGASYYLPGLSIPMLPDTLSEGVVSLNAHEDHRAMIIEIRLDKDGNVESNRVERAVIHSQAQLTYEGVSAELEGQSRIPNDEHGKAVPKAVREQLALFQEIGQKRIAKAKERGVVEPERREMRIGFDDGQFFLRDSKSLIASKLNAEFSILANVGGAEQFLSSTIPGLYVPALFRVHQEPDTGTYKALQRQISIIVNQHQLPASWKWSDNNESLAAWVDRIKEAPTNAHEAQLSQVLQQAAVRINVASEYQCQPSVHSGLKVDHYGRFSAPMREQVGLMSHAVVFAKDALERAAAAGGLSAAEANAVWAPLLLGATVDPKQIPAERRALAEKAQTLMSTSPAELGALAKALAKEALPHGALRPEEQKLVDAVFDRARAAGNSGKMKQGGVDGAARKLLFDDLFVHDLGGNPLGNPNAPKREGFITAVTPAKIYVQLKDPDVEVRLGIEDLTRHCPGAKFDLEDEACALVADQTATSAVSRLMVGNEIKLQATHHDGDRLHFTVVD